LEEIKLNKKQSYHANIGNKVSVNLEINVDINTKKLYVNIIKKVIVLINIKKYIINKNKRKKTGG